MKKYNAKLTFPVNVGSDCCPQSAGANFNNEEIKELAKKHNNAIINSVFDVRWLLYEEARNMIVAIKEHGVHSVEPDVKIKISVDKIETFEFDMGY
jgi:hypothetical protein